MSYNPERFRDYARILLASIRLLNGVAALFTPKFMARRFGDNPNSAVIYALRLFGVRTIVIGVELLLPDEQLRAKALRSAPLIHASDMLSAALVLRQRSPTKQIASGEAPQARWLPPNALLARL